MPLQSQPAARRLASSGWGLTGPILADGTDAESSAPLLSAVMTHVAAIATEVGATTVEVGQSPVTAAALRSPQRSNPFLAAGYVDKSTQTRVLDLTAGEEQLRAGLSKNARQMIKRAQAAGYTVRRADWPAMVDDYYRVHSETYTRTGVAPHPRAYFAGLAREMAPADHAILWAGYAANGRAVAFHNDASFVSGALYHTGCCETAHLESGINYLLMWEAIRGAEARGLPRYEVGEVFPDADDPKQRGLTIFKSKFGGETRRVFKAAMTLAVPSVQESAPKPAFARSLRQLARRLAKPYRRG